MSIIIKESKIHGKGVFAGKDFKKGEVVVRWDSLLGDGKLQDIVVNSPSIFINHSCNPNLTEKEGKNIATKDIQQGEEITYDYEKENIPFLKMKCSCRSESCKRMFCGELLKNS